jgi:hypothetical protein
MAKKTLKPTMKKLPAVREAVKILGGDAPVKEVSKWVKAKYNLDMTEATAQNYVSTARKELRGAIAKPANAKPANTKPTVTKPAPSAARATPLAPATGAPIEQVVEAVTTLKGLVGKLGKGNVLKLVEML